MCYRPSEVMTFWCNYISLQGHGSSSILSRPMDMMYIGGLLISMSIAFLRGFVSTATFLDIISLLYTLKLYGISFCKAQYVVSKLRMFFIVFRASYVSCCKCNDLFYSRLHLDVHTHILRVMSVTSSRISRIRLHTLTFRWDRVVGWPRSQL